MRPTNEMMKNTFELLLLVSTKKCPIRMLLLMISKGNRALQYIGCYGSDARPYPSENQCHGQVVVDNLSGIDSFRNCLIDVWGHELV